MNHTDAMRRAWSLAWKGWGRVGTNPMVGCVILQDGEVAGEGWHSQYGGPHAEVAALKAAGERARGAELIVTLEPCAHHGKTPPCAEAIRSAGISRVIYGADDVDPRAKGGAEALRRSGIAAEGGLAGDEVRAQNAIFFHRHAWKGRPFVAVKLAMSLDGRIADAKGRSQWITGEPARDWVHWLRAGHDAIGVGLGTVKADDPQLTVRGDIKPDKPPLRLVFDSRAELAASSRLVKSARELPVAAMVRADAPDARVDALRAAGVEIVPGMGLATWITALHARGIASVLIEGGGMLAGRLIAAGLVDRLYLLVAPVLLGHSAVPAFGTMEATPLTDAKRWRTVGRRVLGDDTLLVMDKP